MREVNIVKKVKLFRFSELSPQAQQNAIQSWAADEPHDGWSEELDALYKSILEALGFSEINLCFSGFWQQGDGASFNGVYEHKKGAKKAIKKLLLTDWNKPQIFERVMIEVDRIFAVQKRYLYRVGAVVTNNGLYSHSGMMRIETEQVLDTCVLSIADEDEHTLLEAFRGIADIYYGELYDTYYALTSEERAKEYLLDHEDEQEFEENGTLYS